MNSRNNKIIVAVLLVIALGVLLTALVITGKGRAPSPQTSGSSAPLSFSGLWPANKQSSPQKTPDKVVMRIPQEEITALPATMATFTYETTPIITRQVAQAVADNLRISELPTRFPDGRLSFAGGNYQVIFDEKDSLLSVYRIPPEYTTSAPSRDKALAASREFLLINNLLFPDLEINSQNSFPVLLEPEGIWSTPPSGQAFNTYLVGIDYKLPYSVSTQGFLPARYLLIDGDGKVISAQFTYQTLDTNSSQEVSLKGFETVAATLEGQLKDLTLDSSSYTSADVVSIEVTGVKAVYLENGKEPLSPQYLFSGEALMKDGAKAPFRLSLPAR